MLPMRNSEEKHIQIPQFNVNINSISDTPTKFNISSLSEYRSFISVVMMMTDMMMMNKMMRMMKLAMLTSSVFSDMLMAMLMMMAMMTMLMMILMMILMMAMMIVEGWEPIL